MGAETSCHRSQEAYDSLALRLYQNVVREPCFIPDVGLDLSLLKYSGINSNAALQSYSDDQVNQVPGYMEKLGSSLGSMTSFPNAVGLGALVISMILEIIMKSSTETTEDSYSMFRRVFGEEKASGVRDTMSEYVKRHQMYMNDDRLLQTEIQRLEKQLSNHLTILRNSLLYDGQMRSRGFKIWVNGASFHVQMLIHEARLNIQTGISTTDYVHTIQSAITTYMQDLDKLLEKYRTHMTSTTHISYKSFHRFRSLNGCSVKNDIKRCETSRFTGHPISCCFHSCLIEPYINFVFSKYEPLLGLKSHFLNIKNNLIYHINQHDSFTLPSPRITVWTFTISFNVPRKQS